MLYYEIYDFINGWFFGGGTLVGYVDMCCTLLSTALTVFVAILPFIVVYWVIRWLCSMLSSR